MHPTSISDSSKELFENFNLNSEDDLKTSRHNSDTEPLSDLSFDNESNKAVSKANKSTKSVDTQTEQSFLLSLKSNAPKDANTKIEHRSIGTQTEFSSIKIDTMKIGIWLDNEETKLLKKVLLQLEPRNIHFDSMDGLLNFEIAPKHLKERSQGENYAFWVGQYALGYLSLSTFDLEQYVDFQKNTLESNQSLPIKLDISVALHGRKSFTGRYNDGRMIIQL